MCKKSGAAIQCCEGRCRRHYHYGCALKEKCLMELSDDALKFLCTQHAKGGENDRKTKKKNDGKDFQLFDIGGVVDVQEVDEDEAHLNDNRLRAREDGDEGEGSNTDVTPPNEEEEHEPVDPAVDDAHEEGIAEVPPQVEGSEMTKLLESIGLSQYVEKFKSEGMLIDKKIFICMLSLQMKIFLSISM